MVLTVFAHALDKSAIISVESCRESGFLDGPAPKGFFFLLHWKIWLEKLFFLIGRVKGSPRRCREAWSVNLGETYFSMFGTQRLWVRRPPSAGTKLKGRSHIFKAECCGRAEAIIGKLVHHVCFFLKPGHRARPAGCAALPNFNA